MAFISLSHTGSLNPVKLKLPGSKSESNRALILNHLSKGAFKVSNLSSAEDTTSLQTILNNLENEKVIDCGPAGTTFRFLTSLLAFTPGTRILTGSDRMKERPIKDLVDALKKLGCKISYLEKEGYPPLEIEGINTPLSKETEVSVEKSSQFLSSLLMVAPFKSDKMSIKKLGKGGSQPYIDMTLELLERIGAKIEKEGDYIHIVPEAKNEIDFEVESDWSGASYWYSMAALNPGSKIKLKGLREHSLQGDIVLVDIFSKLGVKSTFLKSGVKLEQRGKVCDKIVWDFKNCPDLAQTVFVTCAGLGIAGEFTGLESLRIKETDRIAAMQRELCQFGVCLKEKENNTFYLEPGSPIQPVKGNAMFSVDTYHDHRMAMAFAPLVTRTGNLYIQQPDVVGKSYPNFWEHIQQAGIDVNRPN